MTERLNNYEVTVKSEQGMHAFSIWGTKLTTDILDGVAIVSILDDKEVIFTSLLHENIFVRLTTDIQSVKIMRTGRKKVRVEEEDVE